jgi:hypothetical protein
LARAALDAAERVRPRETSTERTRRHRAKKRAAAKVPANVPSAGNVPEADGGGNVSSRTRPIDTVSAPIDKTNPEAGLLAEHALARFGLDSARAARADLLARLILAANGNVVVEAVDVAPIQVLLATGCDLELDVRSSAISQRAQPRSSAGTIRG